MTERMGPRPLPLHLATEGWIVQLALMGLTPFSPASMLSSGALPLSKPAQNQSPQSPPFDPAKLIAAEAARKSPEAIDGPWPAYLDAPKFLDAVIGAATMRLQRFVDGVRRYQTHDFARALEMPAAVWTRGAAALRDYGGEGPAVVFVPSLINRATILDLASDRSLLRAAAAAGLHTYLLDWGEPGAERGFTLTNYVEGVLIPALAEVARRSGAAPKVVGYCMGGTLSVAPAVLRPDLVGALALLAAPWDFHADSDAARIFMALSRPLLEMMIAAEGAASVDLLQALFATLDPTLTGRKFRRFATLDQDSDDARRFVALEDWLNDGVPLAGPVARECLFDWYGDNTPAKGAWRIGGTVVDPSRVNCPTLAFIPSQDRIVPPRSAAALAAAIPGTEMRTVDLGHIGMVAGGSALKRVYAPLLAWLKQA